MFTSGFAVEPSSGPGSARRLVSAALPAPTGPVLVVLAGRPGVGKTTLSRVLAADLGAALVRLDAIEAALVRSGAVRLPLGPLGYVVAHEVTAGCLAVGTPVVVDAVNPVPEARAGWRGTAAAAGAVLRVVEVVLGDAAEHRRRVEQRRSDLDGHLVPTWEQVLAGDYQDWDVARDGERLLVDAGDGDAALAAVRRFVGGGAGSGRA